MKDILNFLLESQGNPIRLRKTNRPYSYENDELVKKSKNLKSRAAELRTKKDEEKDNAFLYDDLTNAFNNLAKEISNIKADTEIDIDFDDLGYTLRITNDVNKGNEGNSKELYIYQPEGNYDAMNCFWDHGQVEFENTDVVGLGVLCDSIKEFLNYKVTIYSELEDNPGEVIVNSYVKRYGSYRVMVKDLPEVLKKLTEIAKQVGKKW